MASKKRRTRRIEEPHESGEAEPCEDCRAELALLRRAQELQEQEGLTGRDLVDGVMASLQHESELESMWRRKSKKQ